MNEEIRYIPAERDITRVALMRGDEELSRTLVVPMTMRLGHATLRMDGIGGVATPEQHRHKGYSRRVLEAAVAYMTAGDAVLTTLYGIPHFYPKYGFATLGPEYGIQPRSLDERRDLPAGLSTRDGQPGDLAAIKRLYRAETDRAYGPLVREEGWWTWDVIEEGLQPGANEIKVVERAGAVVGYAFRATKCWWLDQWNRKDPEGLKIGEAFAADPSAADAVLAASRQWATDLGQTKVELAVPKTSRVGFAATLQNTIVAESFSDDAEFMGRSTGLLALLRALVPELEARWRPSSGSAPEFAVTIVTEGERVTICGSENGIVIDSDRPGDIEMALNPGTVARLVFGGFDPEAVLERLNVPRAGVPILAMLFPKHVPYIYPVDRF